MALIQQLNTLRRAMTAAEVTEPVYVFEDDGGDPSVVPIPTSLDQRRETLRSMINHQVTIQAEKARLQIEDESISREIRRHRIALSREMLDLGIPAPMANEELE